MKLRARAVPVLMYHHVSPSPGMITVSPDHFAGQMACLAERGYRTLSGSQFAAYLAGAPVPQKSFVITFDDGYLDNWVHAHPVLRRHGFNALCFLVTAWPGEGAPRPHAADSGEALPRLLSHAEGAAAIENGSPDDAVLRWSEIDEMRRAGTFEFHSHTHTHIRWDRVTPDRDEKRERLRDDLTKARATLRWRLGDVSDHLCWPQGYYDDDYREIALGAGFRHFYTCDRGTNPAPRGTSSKGGERSINRLEVRDKAASWLASRMWVHSRPAFSRAYLAIKR